MTGAALASALREDGHGQYQLRFPAGLKISHHEVSASQRCEVDLDRFLSWHHCQKDFFRWGCFLLPSVVKVFGGTRRKE